MKSRVWLVSLLTVSTLGIGTLPTRADEATVQQCSQDIVITGNDNYAQQGCTQVNVQNREGRSRRSNTGRVLTGTQRVDILGDYNETHQNINQRNTESDRQPRARRRYR
ncbi:hypothetical protein [Merismopedia glauca]|uniref:Uncharacterized protein n=1 Tax=Merismopedia glauca CCAP 1448/3 TaxID=1296344 RepID=A0A2T1C948_9CYAN|nr:hypothetical protein [Merismopedia glauca]PSB04764.1 hypothetical protein C7B64_02795 [Merismopedia glauca CCAP 1448/3]